MRIRLHGSRDEITRTLAALGKVLDIGTISRPYRDRPPSTLVRVYLDTSPAGHNKTPAMWPSQGSFRGLHDDSSAR